MSLTYSYSIFYPSHRVKLSDEDTERMRSAVEFLNQFDPLAVSDIELEYIVMHTAFLVNESNAFTDNYNVEPNRRKAFLDHMDHALTSDVNAWCKKLYECGFWRNENFAIVTLIWNWLSRSLANPTSFL